MVRITGFLAIVLALIVSITLVAEAEHTGFECNGSKNQKALDACSPFTWRGAKEPSGECCSRFRAFIETAKTAEERRELCSCVQRNTIVYKAIVKNVDALWGICGVPFLFSSDSKFDCNSVN
nr:PREDICTED: non-specific lipid-transfer protein 1-like [Daucus carota subsp. sativus]